MYNKPTDTHLFLHHTSAHPSSVTSKGPYGQYLRLRRICTLNSDFEENADKLTQYYIGYPIKQLKNHHQRVKKFTQQELLQVNSTKKAANTPPVMVTKYNPKNPNIKKFIHSNWNMIEHCDELKKIFTLKPLIGFRRLPNLRDILTKIKISYPPKNHLRDEKPKICTRLGRCTYCPRLTKISEFKSHHTGATHKCINLPKNTWLICEISNIVYLIDALNVVNNILEKQKEHSDKECMNTLQVSKNKII